jgi:hypothetical protein
MVTSPSVIIDNLNLTCVAIFPDKTNAPLIVDANAVLPNPITPECFEPIVGRHSQKTQVARRVNLL